MMNAIASNCLALARMNWLVCTVHESLREGFFFDLEDSEQCVNAVSVQTKIRGTVKHELVRTIRKYPIDARKVKSR